MVGVGNALTSTPQLAKYQTANIYWHVHTQYCKYTEERTRRHDSIQSEKRTLTIVPRAERAIVLCADDKDNA